MSPEDWRLTLVISIVDDGDDDLDVDDELNQYLEQREDTFHSFTPEKNYSD